MAHVSTIGSMQNRSWRNDRPDPNSKIGRIYDLLQPGRIVPRDDLVAITKTKNFNSVIEYLRNSYGLDVRRIRHREWCRVGEYVNGEYVDHIAALTKAEG